MREDIHPVYPAAKVTCACGNVIETRSTRGSFSVEVCSNCHPFFTGKYKLLDTAGRVDRFNKKYGSKSGSVLADAAGTSETAKTEKAAKAAAAPKSEKIPKAPKAPKAPKTDAEPKAKA